MSDGACCHYCRKYLCECLRRCITCLQWFKGLEAMTDHHCQGVAVQAGREGQG